jgi:hypothetical protein
MEDLSLSNRRGRDDTDVEFYGVYLFVRVHPIESSIIQVTVEDYDQLRDRLQL